ncbi:hypothetical protein [Helicobacter typhlonius]
MSTTTAAAANIGGGNSHISLIPMGRISNSICNPSFEIKVISRLKSK